MKKTTKFINVLSIAGVAAIMGGVGVQAQSYTDATHAQGEGKIEFIQSTKTEIYNPEDPDEEVVPENPNPNMDALMIQYVSDFEFGKRERTGKEIWQPATMDTTVKTVDGTQKDVYPFVSTLDLRADRKSGWTLNVTPSAFKTAKHTIPGAEVVLSNVNYADSKAETGRNETKPAVNGTAANTDFKKGLTLSPGSTYSVASADASLSPKGQGVGSYSLSLGNEVINQTTSTHDEDTEIAATNGVYFHMPANTGVDIETPYLATFDWELLPTLELN